MLHRILLSIALALLFALGQQGAAAHAISHYSDWQQQEKQGHHQSSSCDQCIVYAGLGSTIHSSPPALPPCRHQHVFHAAQVSHDVTTFAVPYTARAPPFLA